MANHREYETSLRAASLGFLAGAHFISKRYAEEFSHLLTDVELETLAERLQMFLRRTRKHAKSAELLAHLLNEEGLFPFEDQWNATDLERLLHHIKTPKVLEDAPFKMIQGFRKNLNIISREAVLINDEDSNHATSMGDHWLVLLVNLAFFAGSLALARLTSLAGGFPYGPKGQQKLAALTSQWALDLLEEEPQQSEVWTQYAQLNNLVEETIAQEADQLQQFSDSEENDDMEDDSPRHQKTAEEEASDLESQWQTEGISENFYNDDDSDDSDDGGPYHA